MMGTNSLLHSERSAIFAHGVYNALGSVEQAHEIIDKNIDFDEFLRQLGILLYKSGCGRNFGAFLLHRHFTPGPGQIPLEVPTVWGDSNELALVTRMLEPSSFDSAIAPSRWRYNRDKHFFEALEFSTDPDVVEQWKHLLAKPRLMSDVAKLIQKFDLADIIGFATAKRQSLPKQNDELYIEISDITAKASVVRADCESELPVGGKKLPTVWVPTVACWCEKKTICHYFACISIGSTHFHNPPGDHQRVEGTHKVVPCV